MKKQFVKNENGRIIQPDDIKTLFPLVDNKSIGVRLTDGSIYRMKFGDVLGCLAFLQGLDVRFVVDQKKGHGYLRIDDEYDHLDEEADIVAVHK